MYVCVDTHTLLEADNLGSHIDPFSWICVRNKTVEAMMAPRTIVS